MGFINNMNNIFFSVEADKKVQLRKINDGYARGVFLCVDRRVVSLFSQNQCISKRGRNTVHRSVTPMGVFNLVWSCPLVLSRDPLAPVKKVICVGDVRRSPETLPNVT